MLEKSGVAKAEDDEGVFFFGSYENPNSSALDSFRSDGFPSSINL
jgi:hypothetical protein